MELYFRDSKMTFNLTGFVFVVPGVIVVARLPVYCIEKLFEVPPQTGVIITWVIATIFFYLSL